MNDISNNVSVAEFAQIRSRALDVLLTVMLSINALAITVSIAILDQGFSYPENLGIALSVLSSSGAIFIGFLLKRYLETITYKFYRIDHERLESISKLAKRFFRPFMLSIVLDSSLAFLSVATLLMALWQQQ